MKSIEQRRADITSALDELLMYRNSGGIRELIVLLDVVIDDSLARLATVSPDNLLRQQGALAQLNALRTSIAEPGPDRSLTV